LIVKLLELHLYSSDIVFFYMQVFQKHGVEKYESLGEPFDPNRHSAVFEVQDATKPAGSVAMELKVCLC
jgi:hypothetical protein